MSTVLSGAPPLGDCDVASRQYSMPPPAHVCFLVVHFTAAELRAEAAPQPKVAWVQGDHTPAQLIGCVCLAGELNRLHTATPCTGCCGMRIGSAGMVLLADVWMGCTSGEVQQEARPGCARIVEQHNRKSRIEIGWCALAKRYSWRHSVEVPVHKNKTSGIPRK
jgi:hypothetical protein